jgi:elongation factor 1-alpha
MEGARRHASVIFLGAKGVGKATLRECLIFHCGGVHHRQKTKIQEEAKRYGVSAFQYYLEDHRRICERGFTIASRSCEFFGQNHFTVIDPPGHRDFIRNMIRGSSSADVAVLVLDGRKASEVDDVSLRQVRLLRALGVEYFVVCVNHMDNDNVGSEAVFSAMVAAVRRMAVKVGLLHEPPVVPVLAERGDNVAPLNAKLKWWNGVGVCFPGGGLEGALAAVYCFLACWRFGGHDEPVTTLHRDVVRLIASMVLNSRFHAVWRRIPGPVTQCETLLDVLDAVPPPLYDTEGPVRIPVSGVYKIKPGKNRKRMDVVTGRVETGRLYPEQDVLFVPSNIRSKVLSMEMHHKRLSCVEAGMNIGIECARFAPEGPKVGDVLIVADQKPPALIATRHIEAHMMVLEKPFLGVPLTVMMLTARAPCTVVLLGHKEPDMGDWVRVELVLEESLMVPPDLSQCMPLRLVLMSDRNSVMVGNVVRSKTFEV